MTYSSVAFGDIHVLKNMEIKSKIPFIYLANCTFKIEESSHLEITFFKLDND